MSTIPDKVSVFEAILASLTEAAEYNQNDHVSPAVILWTDKDRQWQPLAAKLRSALPQFVTLGQYDPKAKTGPAIWLRCMVARTVPEADWDEGVVPILYLPGVSRQELRAVEDCAPHLQPLAELQYRGVFWTQKNAKDWTVAAFLQTNDGGLKLDVSRDHATAQAILRAVVRISETSIGELRGKRLEAADFHALLTPDPVKAVLTWLCDPVGCQQSWSAEQWGAFRGVCHERFDFDPEGDGDVVAAENLGLREGNWNAVWERFKEAPLLYPQLHELLGRAKPTLAGKIMYFEDKESWPQFNDEAEGDLRSALTEIKSLGRNDAIKRVEQLESEHGPRRSWVWAKMGRAPLATVLESLAKLATTCKTTLTGVDPDAMAQAYMASGWQADAAVISAMAELDAAANIDAVHTAIRAVYLRWLESAAERFQELVKHSRLPSLNDQQLTPVEDGCCVLFVDGLRYDVGQMLRSEMEQAEWSVTSDHRWVAVPPVTATAKPAVSPIADMFGGESIGGEQFCPLISRDQKSLTVDRFRALLIEKGIQVLDATDAGDPRGKAWTEFGQLDRRGHDEGWRLAKLIKDTLRGVIDRMQTLFDAGWREVRVVTDHGWLLMPGKLPKVDLPAYLTETRWSRCAVVKQGSTPQIQTGPWYWDSHVQIAYAPGISCFRTGKEYAHGSLTIQECLIPQFVVRPPFVPGPSAMITSIKWLGLRCRVTADGQVEDLAVDIRTKAADVATSLAGGPKSFGADKTVSIPVLVDDAEGAAAMIVLVDSNGRVLQKRPTSVGGEE